MCNTQTPYAIGNIPIEWRNVRFSVCGSKCVKFFFALFFTITKTNSSVWLFSSFYFLLLVTDERCFSVFLFDDSEEMYRRWPIDSRRYVLCICDELASNYSITVFAFQFFLWPIIHHLFCWQLLNWSPQIAINGLRIKIAIFIFRIYSCTLSDEIQIANLLLRVWCTTISFLLYCIQVLKKNWKKIYISFGFIVDRRSDDEHTTNIQTTSTRFSCRTYTKLFQFDFVCLTTRCVCINVASLPPLLLLLLLFYSLRCVDRSPLPALFCLYLCPSLSSIGDDRSRHWSRTRKNSTVFLYSTLPLLILIVCLLCVDPFHSTTLCVRYTVPNTIQMFWVRKVTRSYVHCFLRRLSLHIVRILGSWVSSLDRSFTWSE